MESVILVIHLILALAIIALVLLQRSEGGGLGIGGGNGGMGGLASARGTANALTKLTGLFAAGFFITSLSLGYIASQKHSASKGILESVNQEEIQAPVVDDIVPPDAGITYVPPEEMKIPEVNIEDVKTIVKDVVEPLEKAVEDSDAPSVATEAPADKPLEKPSSE